MVVVFEGFGIYCTGAFEFSFVDEIIVIQLFALLYKGRIRWCVSDIVIRIHPQIVMGLCSFDQTATGCGPFLTVAKWQAWWHDWFSGLDLLQQHFSIGFIVQVLKFNVWVYGIFIKCHLIIYLFFGLVFVSLLDTSE